MWLRLIFNMKDLSKLSGIELKEYAKKLSFDISKFHNFQINKKIQLNSCYGAMGNEFFRFFDIRLAEAVTLSGQLVIQWIAKDVNQYLNNLLKTHNIEYVFYIDTDSIYVTLGELVSKIYSKNPPSDKHKVATLLDKFCEDKLQNVINDSCLNLKNYLNSRSQKMQMKRESIADRGIWTAKKRYILNVYDNEGVKYDSPKLKMQGIEAIKSSTPEICRDKITEAIKIMLNKRQEDLHEFVKNFRHEFDKLDPEEIAFPRGCNGISKYSDSSKLYKLGTPAHTKGSIIYNDLLSKHGLTKKYQIIQDGDKIKFLYLKAPNPAKDSVISILDVLPKEFNLHKYIDFETQFQKSFLDPLKYILDAIKWTSKKTASFASL
jgi:DNA polymerase elongation subunit (family B)